MRPAHFTRIATIALALAAVAGLQAVAQSGSRAGLGGASLPQISGVSRPVQTQPSRSTSEPKDLSGMLAAQNAARRGLNLASLAWSADLTALAAKTAAMISTRACSKAGSTQAADEVGAAVYWAAPLPRITGAHSPQSVSPGFLVSEWQAGRADFDTATGECPRLSECRAWLRMVAPAARQVGCVRVLCPSQAQVFLCRYDAPKPPARDLRRRMSD